MVFNVISKNPPYKSLLMAFNVLQKKSPKQLAVSNPRRV